MWPKKSALQQTNHYSFPFSFEITNTVTETEEGNIQVQVEVHEQDCEIHHSFPEGE